MMFPACHLTNAFDGRIFIKSFQICWLKCSKNESFCFNNFFVYSEMSIHILTPYIKFRFV